MDNLPDVVHVAASELGVELQLAVPSKAWYFDGHFPGFPLVPGFLLLGWARYWVQQYFPAVGGFTRVTQLKFQGQVQPSAQLTLKLETKEIGGAASVRFKYYSGSDAVSTGTLHFLAVENA